MQQIQITLPKVELPQGHIVLRHQVRCKRMAGGALAISTHMLLGAPTGQALGSINANS